MHSAAWDETYDYTGKRLAVIGIGSSGIQILPQVAKSMLCPSIVSDLTLTPVHLL